MKNYYQCVAGRQELSGDTDAVKGNMRGGGGGVGWGELIKPQLFIKCAGNIRKIQ